MKIKPGTFWPVIIAGALGLHVLAMMVMVSFATSNDSYAVEPDYYRKALNWDDKRAQDHRNNELGWQLTFAVKPVDPGIDPTLRVDLVDEHDTPIYEARVEVEAFSNIRRDVVHHATVAPSNEGYEVSMPMHGNGRWEFRFVVTRGDDVFTYAETRHVYPQKPEQ